MWSIHSSRFTLILCLGLAGSGCYHTGELGQIGFDLGGLADRLYEFRSGDRVLSGTRMCPTLVANNVEGGDGWDYLHTPEDTAALRACFDETLTGPATIDAEGCLSFAGAGEVVWSLEPTGTCELDSVDADLLRFAVVEPSPELQLGFDDWRDRLLDGSSPFGEVTLIGLAAGSSAADLREDPLAERRVVVGEVDAPMLRLDDVGGRVFWIHQPDTLSIEGSGIEAVSLDEDDYLFSGELPVRLGPNATGKLRAELPNGLSLESPSLIGVDASEAASLDLVVGSQEGDPKGARAIVRDAQGRVLHAAPVEWEVSEGVISVYPGSLENDARTPDYASLSTRCEEPLLDEPDVRSAVLTARLGELEDSVAIEWTVPPEPNPPLFFIPDENCMGPGFGDDGPGGGDEVGEDEGGDTEQGCSCTTDPAAPRGGAALLALLALGLVRLRPRARARL